MLADGCGQLEVALGQPNASNRDAAVVALDEGLTRSAVSIIAYEPTIIEGLRLAVKAYHLNTVSAEHIAKRCPGGTAHRGCA